ncbi:hypothetical protein Q4Q85_04100 [Morganella morganii]
MSDKTAASRGERWGIKAAYKAKWLIKKLKAFDKNCVEAPKAKICRVGWGIFHWYL